MSETMQAAITLGVAAFLLFAILGLTFRSPKEPTE